MPIVAQNGTTVLDAYFRNSGGSQVDASSVSLTIRTLGNVIVVGPVAEPTILNPSLGYYTYEWDTTGEPLGDYIATWTGVFLGEDLAGVDQVSIVVPGYIDVGPLDLNMLVAPEQLDGVRNVMGLTLWDLSDDLIQTLEFAWQAELIVKMAYPDWAVALAGTDPTLVKLLKLASVYATAALISESFAKGGTIGNTEGGDAGKERDWAKFAAVMWARFQLAMDALKASDLTVEETYDIDMFKIASPSRLVGRDWTSAYPPMFDSELISPQTS